jgi:hypothetical protein
MAKGETSKPIPFLINLWIHSISFVIYAKENLLANPGAKLN